ncbi:histidine kinase dimerization/phospho-acceptor domain-containing protein [Paenibacillaceae bacterium T2]|uniref:histidine kinase n=1 Tax=Ferviditalea candida TaxID=3108399 RepID=A0ABU5ZKC2_9BACL|nr:histidine kinase dimerization/phospho-acceptor domain-containing protein [Paenibacillaceae bacterium T2]
MENVSHDLRTPMASIQSFMEAIQDNAIRDEQTFARYLDTIRLETRRLSGLIEDLLQLSRLQAGTKTLCPERCHLKDLFLEILQSYTLRWRRRICRSSSGFRRRFRLRLSCLRQPPG